MNDDIGAGLILDDLLEPGEPVAPLADVVDAAWALVHAQGRMLDRWAEADKAVKRKLWCDLHEKGDTLRDRLEILEDEAVEFSEGDDKGSAQRWLEE